MQVVGSARATFRAVIEHCHCRIVGQQTANLAVVARDLLRTVVHGRYREMHGKNGEWVHQKLKSAIKRLRYLLFGPVCGTEEARSLGNGLIVDFRSGAYDACGIEL